MEVTCQRCGWQGEIAQYCSRCGASLGTSTVAARGPFAPPPVSPPAPAPATVRITASGRPAGFWIRFVAVLIDGVVLLVAQGILFSAGWMVSGGSTGGGMAVKGVVNVFHWLWGQTLGKMALQIKVVSMDGGPLTFGQAAGRYFATFLSAIILCIGFIMAGIRTDKRALHDLLAGTRVIRL